MDRHVKAKRLSGFQIDHQLEFDRSLHRKLTWLLAFKNAINIRRRAPKIIGQIISDKSTVRVHRRKLIPGRKCNYLLAVSEGRGASYHDESTIRLMRKCANATFDLAG